MKITCAVLAGLLALAAVPASAQLDKIKLSDTIQSIKFSGDIRLRSDSYKKRGPGLNDRNRLRYRLRFGPVIELPENLSAIIRLGSGTGEQVSTNQSYDNLSGQKALWVDLMYLRWKPTFNDNATASVQAGRMANPLWRTYSSDVVWDDDFNPEGFGESVEWLFPDAGVSVFANGLQAVADEDSGRGKNQMYFSQQLGFETRLPLDSRLRVAGAYHKWSDENQSTLSQASFQDGNRRAANSSSGALLNRFGVGEVTGQLSGWAGGIPVSLQATVVRNLRAIDFATPAFAVGPVARDAYQFGAIIGAAKKTGSWELGYFKKYVQTDATVADVADSDFGDGGTNRVGHIAWVAYAPRDWMLLKAKGFVTDTIDRQFLPGDKAVNRLQVDVAVKF